MHSCTHAHMHMQMSTPDLGTSRYPNALPKDYLGATAPQDVVPTSHRGEEGSEMDRKDHSRCALVTGRSQPLPQVKITSPRYSRSPNLERKHLQGSLLEKGGGQKTKRAPHRAGVTDPATSFSASGARGKKAKLRMCRLFRQSESAPALFPNWPGVQELGKPLI